MLELIINVNVFSSHSNEAKTKTDTMLDAFILTTITSHASHAPCARWGIYPVSGFFFFCAVFTNAFVLLNLARAVVIHSYIKTDAQFWRRRPDDVTREPMNLIYYMRQPYEDYRGVMRMRKFRKSQVKGYAMELMVAKGKAREQAQDAIDDEKERVRELKKAEKEAEAAKEAEA